jgi:hypothetical protein
MNKSEYAVHRVGDNYGLFLRGSLVQCGIFATRSTANKYRRLAENYAKDHASFERAVRIADARLTHERNQIEQEHIK